MQNLCMTYYRLQRSPEHVYISSTILNDTLHETECFMTEFNCIYPLTRLKGSSSSRWVRRTQWRDEEFDRVCLFDELHTEHLRRVTMAKSPILMLELRNLFASAIAAWRITIWFEWVIIWLQFIFQLIFNIVLHSEFIALGVHSLPTQSGQAGSLALPIRRQDIR